MKSPQVSMYRNIAFQSNMMILLPETRCAKPRPHSISHKVQNVGRITFVYKLNSTGHAAGTIKISTKTLFGPRMRCATLLRAASVQVQCVVLAALPVAHQSSGTVPSNTCSSWSAGGVLWAFTDRSIVLRALAAG